MLELHGVHLSKPSWRIMIIDDDPTSIQRLCSLLAIRDPKSKPHVPARILSARSSRHIGEEPDIAVILLDVVMEQEDAGLNLVNFVRKESRTDRCPYHFAHGTTWLCAGN